MSYSNVFISNKESEISDSCILLIGYDGHRLRKGYFQEKYLRYDIGGLLPKKIKNLTDYVVRTVRGAILKNPKHKGISVIYDALVPLEGNSQPLCIIEITGDSVTSESVSYYRCLASYLLSAVVDQNIQSESPLVC